MFYVSGYPIPEEPLVAWLSVLNASQLARLDARFFAPDGQQLLVSVPVSFEAITIEGDRSQAILAQVHNSWRFRN